MARATRPCTCTLPFPSVASLEGGRVTGRAVDPLAAPHEALAQEDVEVLGEVAGLLGHELLAVEARAVALGDHRLGDGLVVPEEVAHPRPVRAGGVDGAVDELRV